MSSSNPPPPPTVPNPPGGVRGNVPPVSVPSGVVPPGGGTKK